ncbi:LuxR C-terminal-related transcriptional regulator [Pantoea brenneri]|uniref:LuxR C-terminal-related transcriptional regulator n=1 Tax=Pantoea brenneri TaxID=472694 RepID=UPI0028A06C49|nr:LuxR C-terminal-related transcriptional regulator [Pantoea brenneri]
MDVKVICKDDNLYFKLGIIELIKEAFLFSANVDFLTGFDSNNLAKADIIIINFSQWRLYLCQPAYQYRKKGCLLLVFTDQPDKIIAEELPVCYQSLTVIPWAASVKNVRDKVTKAWLLAHDESSHEFHSSDCARCSFSRISLVQLQVMSFLKKGNNVQHTAKFLGLSVKTVYAHKYNVMKKFNIKGDYEFHSFLNAVSLLELYKGVIKDE